MRTPLYSAGAISAKQNLNQCDIYPNCCTLKVDFAKKEKLVSLMYQILGI